MPTCLFVTLGCKVNQYDSQAIREDLARRGFVEARPEGHVDLCVVNTCCVTSESHHKSLQHIRRLAREHPEAILVVTGCSVETDAVAIRAIPGVRLVVGNEGKPTLAGVAAAAAEQSAVGGPHSPERRHGPEGARIPPFLSLSWLSCDSWRGMLLWPTTIRHERHETARNQPSCGSTVSQESAIPNPHARGWPSISAFAGHTRAFVKIEDGCDDFCSYCIMPYVRGRVRSRPPDEVVEEVRRLVANGYLEIVLTGIHLGAYGTDRGASSVERREQEPKANIPSTLHPPRSTLHIDWGLVPLLRRLVATPGLRRLRLSSLELREVTDELIGLVAGSDVLCPHFHIPLQSGDDTILLAMSRRYTAADFLARVEAIRGRIPEPAVTTDVIAGFPGETDEQFRRTVAVARRAGFTRLHVFPYSDREGTAASRMDGKVAKAVIDARRQEMLAVARELAEAYHGRFVRREIEVLVETQRDRATGLLCGYSERYVRVYFAGPDELRGRMVTVRGVEATPRGVKAEPNRQSVMRNA